jgi:hypothetical protein
MNCVVVCDGVGCGHRGDLEFRSERADYVVVGGTFFFGLLLLVDTNVV